MICGLGSFDSAFIFARVDRFFGDKPPVDISIQCGKNRRAGRSMVTHRRFGGQNLLPEPKAAAGAKKKAGL
jgi:hypothetical protein